MDEDDLRSNRNAYDGTANGPMKRTGAMKVSLSFGAHIDSDEKGRSVLRGFSLCMGEHSDDVAWPEVKAEFEVKLTVEQWQDLIDAMQTELELARVRREKLESAPGDPEEEW